MHQFLIPDLRPASGNNIIELTEIELALSVCIYNSYRESFGCVSQFSPSLLLLFARDVV